MENELQDRYGIGEEKLGWLQEIGAKELKEPYVYSADYGSYYMSERYLRETPLCKLKEFYESKLEPILGVHAADEKLTFARKQIKDMSENEILRQQLELLAESSLKAEPEILVLLSTVMAELLKIECY